VVRVTVTSARTPSSIEPACSGRDQPAAMHTYLSRMVRWSVRPVIRSHQRKIKDL